jgi:uncharacterized protein YbbC (DUF1343 family)
VRGLRFTVTDRAVYDPTRTAVAALIAIHAEQSDSLRFRDAGFDRLAGTAALRLALQAGASLDTIIAGWQPALQRFSTMRQRYLLY